MGWHCGWKSERTYHPSLEKIRAQWRKTNLGRGSGCGFARGACESESARGCAAYFGRLGGIAKGAGGGTPRDNGIGGRAFHRVAVDTFRTLLPSECARKNRAAHSLPSSDPGSKIGIVP